MGNNGPAKIRARRAHLCACSDPTAHRDLKTTLGTSYVGVRRGTFRSVIRLLQESTRVNKAFEEDVVTVSKENARLRAALEKTMDVSVDSPVFEGGLGGRTAIEQYRANAGRFIQVMNEVGTRGLLYGTDAAKFFLSVVVKMDLVCLWAAKSVTEEEETRRGDLVHKLTAVEELALLAMPDKMGDGVRADFMGAVAGSGIDTSVQELVRRSAETLRGTGGRGGDGE